MPFSDRFEQALVYATQVHAKQVRKGSPIPYISHLLSVAAIAIEHGADEDTAIAALLHDAAEDQGGPARLEDIRNRFGDRVAAIVEGCTDAMAAPGEKKPPWRPRKEAYLAHLPEASPEVRLVSAADKLHNARSIVCELRHTGQNVWTKFAGGKEGSLWYYRALADIYLRTGPHPLSQEVDRVVRDMEMLAKE